MNVKHPAGACVLVVNNDPRCLCIVEHMLQQCDYKVTTCGSAVKALEILRKNKEAFDMVISEEPDKDDFKLLELASLEMDLLVMLMSAEGETSLVMKGVSACDYLLKPLRVKELEDVWQHMVRQKQEHIRAWENKREGGNSDIESKVDDMGCSSGRIRRVLWSVGLHGKFVHTVSQLGVDSPPREILQLMDVQDLTIEDVARHLQKYRLYLERINIEARQTWGFKSAAFCRLWRGW